MGNHNALDDTRVIDARDHMLREARAAGHFTEQTISEIGGLIDRFSATLVAELDARLGGDRRYGKVPSWIFEFDISSHAVMVFSFLSARYARKDGLAFPSTRRLAQELRLSRTTIDKAIKELLAIGAMTRQLRQSSTSLHKYAEYTLVYDYNADEQAQAC